MQGRKDGWTIDALEHAAALAMDEIATLTDPTPCVTVAPRYTGDTEGVHQRCATLARIDVQRYGAVSVTSPARSVVDLARERGVDDGIVSADAALRRRATTRAELDDVVRRCAGWPGMVAARTVVRLADGRSESALESVSRIRIAGLHLPTPELQMIILRLDGTYVRRVDFYWDELGVVGEADGRMKYAGVEHQPLWFEKEQEDDMRELGLGAARWGWRQAKDGRLIGAKVQRAVELRPSKRLWIARPA